MACAGCAGCGGCTEPTCPGTCSVNCTGGTCKCGYTICPWPALTGTGCLPNGNCNAFANAKICLKNTAADTWKSDIYTVDCTTTYGVIVDIRWEMTLDGSGNVSLKLKAYQTGTTTLLATIATYGATIALSRCDKSFVVEYQSDGGQCQNWPDGITVAPNCCRDCPVHSGGCQSSDPCGLFFFSGLVCVSITGMAVGGSLPAECSNWNTAYPGSIIECCTIWNDGSPQKAGNRLTIREGSNFIGYVQQGAASFCYFLRDDGTYVWRLELNCRFGNVGFANLAVYECEAADFVCTAGSSNVFSLTEINSICCTTIPETVTVTPTNSGSVDAPFGVCT